MGIDDHRHRLVRDGLDLGEDSRPGAREHRIDEHNALIADQHDRVAAGPRVPLAQLAAGDEIQVVAHFLKRADAQRFLLLQRSGASRQASNRRKDCDQHHSFHGSPPERLMVPEKGAASMFAPPGPIPHARQRDADCCTRHVVLRTENLIPSRCRRWRRHG
jgi:hypothetical protein